MRTILFRGKDQLGNWVEGLLIKHAKYDSDWRWGIVTYSENGKERIENVTFVDPKTIGQFTGLLDKNGKRIFEGDIVDCWADLEDGPYLREVVYGHESQMCGLVFEPFAGFTLCKNNEKHFRVIGNIYDNPTLLKAEV